MPPCFILYYLYFEVLMKKKITYLLKDFDYMMSIVLLHTKDIKSQMELMKNKKEIIDEIDKMCKKYDKIIWNNDKDIFKNWMNGTTGFPIVDAGMREMNETGFMHNRSRLITSNILIKILKSLQILSKDMKESLVESLNNAHKSTKWSNLNGGAPKVSNSSGISKPFIKNLFEMYG